VPLASVKKKDSSNHSLQGTPGGALASGLNVFPPEVAVQVTPTPTAPVAQVKVHVIVGVLSAAKTLQTSAR